MPYIIKPTSVKYGMLLFAASMIGLPFVDALAKILINAQFSVLQVANGRFIFHTLFMVVVLVISGENIIKTFTTYVKAKSIITVGTIGLTLGFYAALQYTSVAIALSILFTAPLITLCISAIFLKEKVTIKHAAACGIGLLGTVIIFKPTGDDFNAGALYALIAAASWSAIMLTNRIYGTGLNPKQTQVFAGFFSVVLYSILICYNSHTPATDIFISDALFWSITGGMGILGAIFYAMVHTAHTHAPASTLAPLQYLEITSGVILDLILFSLFPSLSAWAGIGLIITSGLIILRLSRQKPVV